MPDTTKADIVVKAARGEIGCPYVYGMWGQPCTPANRKKYAGYNPQYRDSIYKQCPVLSGKQSTCRGCKWDGRRAYDCRGFINWCFKQVEITITGGGATSQYNTKANWVQKGSIESMPDCVCAIYRQKGNTMAHAGVHIGGGHVNHAGSPVKEGDIVGYWTHYAIPKGLYEEIPTMIVLRKGSRGAEVADLQQKLAKLGYYKIAVDGIYGTGTVEAVKAFQKAEGLVVDGIAGAKTQTKLADRTAKQEEPKEEPKPVEPEPIPADPEPALGLPAIMAELDAARTALDKAEALIKIAWEVSE